MALKLRWYHYVIGISVGVVVGIWLDEGSSKSSPVAMAKCSIPMKAEKFKLENIAGCTFEAKATAYSPTLLRSVSFNSSNSTCVYTEQAINLDTDSHSETVKLLEIQNARSGYDGKKQLIFKCEFEKFKNSYFVYNEGDFSVVEVDGDPNGGVWQRKRD